MGVNADRDTIRSIFIVSARISKIMLATTLSLLLLVCIAILYIVIIDYNEANTPLIKIESEDVPLGLPEYPGHYNFD